MWSNLPRETEEYIHRNEVPIKVARVDGIDSIESSETRVAGLVERDGDILFVKSQKAGRNWELPGGRVEADESPDAAVKREVKEETGYSVETATPHVAFVWTLPNATVVQLIFSIELGDIVGKPVDEITDLDWFDSVPESVSFGEHGSTTYEILLEDSNITVEVSENLLTLVKSTTNSRKSIAIGAGTVIGSTLVAGLVRRFLSEND